MITEKLKADLYNNLYFLIAEFGTVEDFISLIAQRLRVKVDDRKVEIELHRLLSHLGSIKVISPWALQFRLEDSIESNSIVNSEPYSIFTTTGELLYSIANHNQIFGNSLLDKCLILESENTSMYYLTYPLYSGEDEVVLLITNTISTQVVDSQDYVYTTVPSLLGQTDINQIAFDVNTSYETISFFILPSTPGNIPTREAIKYSRNAQRQDILNAGLGSLLYYPPYSGWLVATCNESTTPQFLKFGDTSGVGEDRFLEASPYIRYVALGDIDPLILRRTLGSSPPLLESLTININCKLYI